MSAQGTTSAELIERKAPSDNVLWLCWWLARHDQPLPAVDVARQLDGRYPGRWPFIAGEALDRRMITFGTYVELTAYGLIAAQTWADHAGAWRLEAMS